MAVKRRHLQYTGALASGAYGPVAQRTGRALLVVHLLKDVHTPTYVWPAWTDLVACFIGIHMVVYATHPFPRLVGAVIFAGHVRNFVYRDQAFYAPPTWAHAAVRRCTR